MTASDRATAWGEVNTILSACMKENARATQVSIEVLMSSIEVLMSSIEVLMSSIEASTIRLPGRAAIFSGLL